MTIDPNSAIRAPGCIEIRLNLIVHLEPMADDQGTRERLQLGEGPPACDWR